MADRAHVETVLGGSCTVRVRQKCVCWNKINSLQTIDHSQHSAAAVTSHLKLGLGLCRRPRAGVFEDGGTFLVWHATLVSATL